MGRITILSAGQTQALCHARELLAQQGFSFAAKPDAAVTHLLLPVPSLESDGSIKGGGDLMSLLPLLPDDITIIGGNLSHPMLADRRTWDLLQQEDYLAENAAITAHCAIKLAMQQLPCVLDGCETLVIGWGRIGKCLARLLRQLDAQVTVAARKETDRAMLRALGYRAIDISQIRPERCRVIFNTAPQTLLPDCVGPALKIDLASKPGITGAGVLWARGLPNKDAPESSGALIAKAVAEYLTETEVIT